MHLVQAHEFIFVIYVLSTFKSWVCMCVCARTCVSDILIWLSKEESNILSLYYYYEMENEMHKQK